MPPKKVGTRRSKIEFAMWANVLGVQASVVIFTGGILGLTEFPRRAISVYAIVFAIVLFLLEWPRGKRMNGHGTMERKYQEKLTPVVKRLGVFHSNYFLRGLIYVVASVALFFVFPLVLGGVILVLSALVYLFAAFRGESWVAIMPRKYETRPKISEAPTHAPPRLVRDNNTAPAAAPLHTANPLTSRAAATTASAAKPPVSATRKKPVASTPAPTDAPPRPTAPSDAPPRPAVAAQPRKAVARANSDFAEEEVMWQAAVDAKSGRTYYYNRQTRETKWEKPIELVRLDSNA
eukprot:m.71193 g.71193  ORF g.71193 m.71193 type:complete len:292 (-) comp16892_c1_seq2:44-919(-)